MNQNPHQFYILLQNKAKVPAIRKILYNFHSFSTVLLLPIPATTLHLCFSLAMLVLPCSCKTQEWSRSRMTYVLCPLEGKIDPLLKFVSCALATLPPQVSNCHLLFMAFLDYPIKINTLRIHWPTSQNYARNVTYPYHTLHIYVAHWLLSVYCTLECKLHVGRDLVQFSSLRITRGPRKTLYKHMLNRWIYSSNYWRIYK